jgi:hypothetical protein
MGELLHKSYSRGDETESTGRGNPFVTANNIVSFERVTVAA